MGSNFGDLNNDGYLDFYLGNGYPEYEELIPNMMYLNKKGKSFVDVSETGGFGHLQKGHAVVFADFDNDGAVDVFEEMGGAFLGDAFKDVLYKNPGFSQNSWITIKLIGVTSNRSAIGARIRIDVKNKKGKIQSIYRHVNSGGSFGANPLRQTIGLGDVQKIHRLEIYWPTTGQFQYWSNVDVNQSIRIKENTSNFSTLDI